MRAGLENRPELGLEAGTRIIADLHLDLGREDPGPRFAAWLDALAGPRLIVLGDLFDYWIGPAQEALPGAAPVLDALARLTARGTPVDLVPGNRDFLLGPWFEARTGAHVHPAGFVGRLPGTEGPAGRLALVHGDELCTLDRGYLRLRAVLRSPPLQWTAPRLPRALALSIARRLRRASVRAVEHKPAAEKAQQPSAVARIAAGAGAETLLCGHAHRFRDERVGGVRWIVLDAFGGRRDLARVEEGGRLVFERSAGGSSGTP